ncbi:hypothetical protein Ndes2526B_g06569 [Nannochloris sp. 'desiccata']|nr:hypothetical protein KSW81_008303 [Chlorella desiccata (nom. nud.)]KAH7619591.1 putative low molecular weight protein-tyrosine-phosphatase [Chlorella desiccata (nom. nud.)]
MITSISVAISSQNFNRAHVSSRSISGSSRYSAYLGQLKITAAKSLHHTAFSTSPPTSTSNTRARTQAPRAMPSSAEQTNKKPTKVLFVCLGNICRSPSAEAVFQATVEKRGVADQYSIDSCGTGGGSSNWYLDGGFSYHEGDNADSRMTRVAATRGVKLTSLSRPLTPEDLEDSDLIIGMDAANLAAIRRAGQYWQKEGRLNPETEASWEKKVGLMTEYLNEDGKFKNKFNEVPDPYYGGEKGFELVLDLLEDACDGLLDTLGKK